jgi:predicted ester cyclase
VAELFTASGTQQGELFGAPPSGQEVSMPGINIWRLRQGRIVERWGRLDELGLLRQLGLAPTP